MKKNQVFIIIIVVLVLVIVGMSIKIFILENAYQKQKNILKETEKEVVSIKEQIQKRCPDKFNFINN